MNSKKTGNVLRDSDGGVFLRVTLPDGKRKSWKLLVNCTVQEQAQRASLLASFVETLSQKHATRIDSVARELCSLPSNDLHTLVETVDALAATDPAVHGQYVTVKDVADAWTSGELAKKFDKYLKPKRSVSDDILRLNKYILPALGHVAIKNITRKMAKEMIGALPAHLSTRTVLNIGHLLSRIMTLAVDQLEIIDSTPLTKGWLPSVTEEKRKLFLYPGEVAQLLGHSQIDLTFRMLCGLQVHEGLRVGEARSLAWADIDFDSKIIGLRAENVKTDVFRKWVLGDDVVRALRAWKDMHSGTRYVFEKPRKNKSEPAEPISYDPTKMAERLRTSLAVASVQRQELYERGPRLIPIRMHDLRATFVTIASATGRDEKWIRNRTGHKSIAILEEYQREIDLAREAGFAWFGDLDAALGIGSKSVGGGQ